ncbi:MAG: hypothetical protein JWQ49_129 [Edaphobacter sp.]|nr:hypothetical protein [Edaphobacter sp.]
MNFFHGTILSLLLLLSGQFNIPRRTGATAASAGGSTIAFVSGASHQCYASSGGGTTLACTVSAATATDTFVIWTGSSDPAAITLGDSGSGTVTPCSLNPVSWVSTHANNGRAACFTVANIGAGPHTLTTTFGASVTYPWIQVIEFSGASTTAPQDVSVGAGGNGGTVMDSGALTTGQANEMLVAFCQIGAGGVTVAPGTGFTLVPSTDTNIASEYLSKPSIGTYHGTCSGQTSTQDWVVTMVALK